MTLKVQAYTVQHLQDLLAEAAQTSSHIVAAKPQYPCLIEYLEKVRVKSVLVEREYIDRDFLEDFVGYYVRCFTPYYSRCVRIHFFEIEFTEKDLDQLLNGIPSSLDISGLQNAYIGFIVVRPLPETIIGRTCLKTYNLEKQRIDEYPKEARYFPIVRTYSANLFGIELQVKTIAFQEQDRVAAACASSALWSGLHATGKLFQHRIPSPVEITKIANTLSPIDTRSLPNRGLTTLQIASVIRGVDLEPLVFNAGDLQTLKSTLYAYLKGSIPVFMLLDLYEENKDKKFVYKGKHAVTVTGYHLAKNKPSTQESPKIRIRAFDIDKIYVHDDQVGPFARMEFSQKKMVLINEAVEIELETLSTSYGGKIAHRAVPQCVVIPLYEKIRINITLIQKTIIDFNNFLLQLSTFYNDQMKTTLDCNFEWDVYLSTINQLKNDYLQIDLNLLNSKVKIELSKSSMPKFMWCATAFHKEKLVLTILFDATDIEQGKYFVRVVEYEKNLSKVLRSISKADWLEQEFDIGRSWRILEWYKQQPIEIKDNESH
jgi:hypothetical protein